MDMQAQGQNFSSTLNEQRFTFTGTGGEYFRIWIVNLFLNILTLGIFSAWAKVRRLQYFYRNTHIGDASFDYHGSPIAILKGRLIGVALFALYSITFQFMPPVGVLVLVGIYLIMPYLLVTSFRFRLYNTSFRGLRFGFNGSVPGAYGVFLGLPILSIFTLGLLGPFVHQRTKAYQHNNSRFGQSHFSFDASVGSFYVVYLLAIGLELLLLAAFGALGFALFKDTLTGAPKQQTFMAILAGVYGMLILSSLVLIPYLISRIQNLIWNHTELAGNRFSSELSTRSLMWIMVTNFIFTVLTLGLYHPFAAVRMAKYRVESMSLLAAGDINEFLAGEQQKAGAAGMETAEVFDIDVGF